MKAIYNILPKALLNSAIPLKEFGILDFAWNSTDIFQIIEIFESIKEPILGGDVYRFEEGKLFQTYDSWYLNNTNTPDFYLVSQKATQSYIKNYELKNAGHYVYSIVTPLMIQWAAWRRQMGL